MSNIVGYSLYELKIILERGKKVPMLQVQLPSISLLCLHIHELRHTENDKQLRKESKFFFFFKRI